MTFNFHVALLALIAISQIASAAENNTIGVGGVALARPLVLRSDFAPKEVIQRLFVRSNLRTPSTAATFVGRHPSLCMEYFHPDYIAACGEYVRGGLASPPVPQLKNGSFCEVGLGFDVYGGPKFEHVLLRKKVHFWETEFLTDYRGAMCKHMAQQVAKNPDCFRGVLHEDTINQYVQWAKTGKGTLNNPVLANGEVVEFHHDVGSKDILALSRSEHRAQATLPSKGHGSGTSIAGGGNITWAQKTTFGNALGMSAQRWGGMAGFDLAVSTLALSFSECQDTSQYIANAGSVAAACLSATLTESVMVWAFPLSSGTTPAWLGVFGISSGGPAAWIATGVYLVVRQSVMHGWEKHQMAKAEQLEKACKRVEQDARQQILLRNLEHNNQTLQAIVSGAS